MRQLEPQVQQFFSICNLVMNRHKGHDLKLGLARSLASQIVLKNWVCQKIQDGDRRMLQE